MVHALDILEALAFEPAADFVGRDDRRTGPLRDIYDIGYVIAVPVRNENEVSRNFFDIDFFREWVWGDEWIEEERFSAGLDRKTGVPVVSKLHRITY